MNGKRNWKPLTPDTWKDFETLFGPRGACGGCWCMTWRLPLATFKSNGSAGNRAAMRALVDAGHEPGVLLYEDGHAVAWCAVAPREEYVRLGASRVWAPVDKAKVWSVSCFFVEKKARGRGLTVAVLNAAAEFARSRGAKILEGYPQELKEKLPPAFVWTGVMPTFVHAGFREAERRSPKKPIMRMVVAKDKAKSKVKSEAKSNYPTLRPKDGRKGRAPGAAKTAAKKSGAKTQ
jgi:GNAT superfamily N-acetyltransferase